LGATQFVILEQDLFDLLHLRCDLRHPSRNGLFLDALDALDSGQGISVGQHRQALDDRFFAVMLPVKDRPTRFGDDFSTSRALPSLATFASESELPQVACIDATVIRTRFIPSEGIWSG